MREVSVANALFFNAAAFMGTGVGWYPAFYSLAFVPIGVAGFTTYGWAAIIVGAAGVFLGLIFASLSTVMPRSGGDYVFTSRFIPRIGPFLGWLESFTLVFASLAIVAFEVPVVLRTLQISGRIVGIGTGIDFFERANGWYAEDGVITGWPGFLASLVVLALIFWVCVQPTRRFHRIVTTLAVVAVASAVTIFVFGSLFIDAQAFARNLPRYADGATVEQLRRAAIDNGVLGNGVQVFNSLFPFVMAVVLLNYIGYQYSAYIAGEVRGNITRGILIAVLGALVIAVVTNSVFVDVLSRKLGLDAQLGWGVLFWSGDPNTPFGHPNTLPLTATISRPGLWPLWLLVSLGGVVSPFVLCPAYVNFISRVALAWSLDRQVPEWFGDVNERLRAPLNAILTALALVGILTLLQNFPILPDSLAPPEGKLNLVATLWFSILMALLTWVMPAINAIVAPFSRPDLVRSAPWRSWLPIFGLIWLAFAGVTYWFAGIDPILDAIRLVLQPGTEETLLAYLNRTGITFTLGIVVVAVVIYVLQWVRNRARGIDLSMMYREIPPE
ncbi:MAG TPA: APC family permease [Actinomycetota bacterium]|nr:APC family permease [Actinomycetota bacterium]